MEMTREQAQQWLQEVDAVAKELRNKLAYGITGPILIIWGIVWIVCYTLNHFAHKISGWVWLVGIVLGMAGTFYLRAVRYRTTVDGESSKRLGRRLLWSWGLLFAYIGIWLAVLWPWRGDQIGTFLVMLMMFAYVLMGLWLQRRFLLWLGLAVTLLAGAGYAFSLWVTPGYLDLWLGLTGGTALLGSGLYMTLRWR
jgi:hypothetical protein